MFKETCLSIKCRASCEKTERKLKMLQRRHFQVNLDNFFDIAQADLLERLKIEEDKIFLELV